ncbi:protein-tyrosine phosphatase-like protein [Chlamydoabsidia padenii]|nr:protein-tyrosine phosphatase-like protein [Chlamydoabsidia padenii]
MYERRNSPSEYPGSKRLQTPLITPPTLIEYDQTRFLIVDTPSTNNLPLYLKEFERWHVTDVVRCCVSTYPKEFLQEKGIEVHDWVFDDGASPPAGIVDAWLNLINKRFYQEPTGGCIAIHCVAGLGRAPVLVAIALVEQGLSALDAVDYIRQRRRGAINNKQLKFIESYKPRSKKQCIIS